MTSRTKLSAQDLRAAITTFAGLLRSHKDVINRLNVFPVPDGDTGTNMALTVESVVDAFGPLADDASMDEVCTAIAHGSLMGARGNSGVILSQLLRGLVEKFKSAAVITPALLAESLSHADVLARQAVVRPVEGTILSVARAAAQGANAATTSLSKVVRGARDRAREALAHTPEQLPVLKQAGVVDSGGTGLLLFFDALCHVVSNDALPVPPSLDSLDVHDVAATNSTSVASGSPRYEVMYLLAAEDDRMRAFRDVWSGLGDSIVIVGGDGLYNCHIHTDEIGPAIEAALDAGRPREIRVTDLAEQVLEEHWVRDAATAAIEADGPAPATAVVAVVAGDGVGRIFRSLGVRVLVSGGQSMNPSTADLVEAVRAAGSDHVVVLPNNSNIVPVANQVDSLVDASVSVVPTLSIVGGFAALLAYDPNADGATNVRAMTDAAEHVRAGEVTRAVRNATTDAGEVHEGDWIGVDADSVRSIAESIEAASIALLDSMITGDHELLTIIEGEGSSAAVTRQITEFVGETHPSVGIEVHHGGQPVYPYFFGLE
ncbi:MAG: DAK2 domain-containing protein [Acidimicrobiales bacterium]